MMCAKAFGADLVAITDVKPDNLVLAGQLGADTALHLDPAAAPAEVNSFTSAWVAPESSNRVTELWVKHFVFHAAEYVGLA